MFDSLSLLHSWASKKALDLLYQNIVTWWRKSKPRRILMIGPGGVGKSTFARLMAGDGSVLPSGEYVESVCTEEFTLADDPSVAIVVPPGQTHRQDATWTSVLSEVRDGGIRGVILVVSYGHHALGDISFRNHRLYNERLDVESFVSDFIADGIKKESEVLERICEAVRECDKPIWLLTLVTKQDLWFEERVAVERHFSSGKFAKTSEKCKGRKAATDFRHETVFASLVIQNLTTGRDEVLKKNVAGYDAAQQEKSFERLLQVVNGLMIWEKEHG